jgi:LuxR family maltose regulon positive regulatory protein
MDIVLDPSVASRIDGVVPRSSVSVPPFTGVPRPRLVARLDHGVTGRLTVLSAPAGWGKSTLVAEWASQALLAVAWVTLDPTVTTPDRLLRMLVAALDRVVPLRFDDVATMLRTANPAVTDLAADAFLDALANLPSPVAVVLDDAHHLVTPDVKNLLHRLVDDGPDTLRLVLTVRGDVRLPLARLRSSGNVTIVRDPDLAFSVAEATALLSPNTALGDRAVQQLVERTEGWAAGLRLAALSLDGATNPQGVLDRLRGTHRDISDYFVEEVLDCLDPNLVQFLVETSILDSLAAPLATAVTGTGEPFAQAIASGVFLIPQDDERTWYRYHTLFRDVLTLRFEALPVERRQTLHRRASDWYEANGLIHDSIRQALGVGDIDRIATLVERHANTLMYECGDIAFLVEVFDELPRDLVASRPALLRVQAWALTIAGRVDQAERLLQRGCDVCDDDLDPYLLAVKARVAAYRGDHRTTIAFGRQALDRFDVLTDGQLIADVTLSMGFAERAMGRIEVAAATYSEAARLGRQYRNGQAARWGVRYLALSRIAQGRLSEALAIVDEDLERLDRAGDAGGSHRGALLVTRAEILVERNQLEEAAAALDPASGMIQHDGDAKILMGAYVARAMLAVAEGDFETAREKARRAEELHPPSIPRTWTALVALAQNDLATAERWARSTGFEPGDEPDIARGDLEQLLYARIVSALEVPGSIDLLERHVEVATREGWHGRAIAFRVALARALAVAGDDVAAELALCDAIREAARDGHFQVFLNERTPVRLLLRDILRTRDVLDEHCRAFALDLLARFPGQPAGSERGTVVPGLAEALTGRQLEILQLLADGRSNREIADALYIAEGTVKAHMHQLFGKLVARNRTEAVANARDLSLIP